MKFRTSSILITIAVLVGMTILPGIGAAQSNQLMLADIVIALRSKKVSLPERNKIIADAVVVRGITFALTPEIEKELKDTGADKVLIDSIRQKNHVVKVAAIVSTPVETKPKPEPLAPPPPDFSFYQKRAEAAFTKGDADAALADYSKAIEMNPRSLESLLGRASLYSTKQSIDLAIADYDKAVQIKPDAATYLKRAELLEKKGESTLAMADYNNALDIEPFNASAKSAATRIAAAEQARLAQKPDPVVTQPAQQPKVMPEFIDLGQLTKDQAVTLASPVYPEAASRAGINGRVVVDVTLDTDGKVVSAKAKEGPAFLKQSAEAAAMRSKFKPALVDGKAIKAKGYISYNFTSQR